MAKILGIEFAPLQVPMQRRLQTLAILKFIFTFLFAGILGTIVVISLLFTRLYFVALIYAVWYVVDRKTPCRGGRRFEWPRNWKIWTYCCDYFPLKLVKTVDIPSSGNYIFAYHPHGIFGIGGFMNFATEGSGFSKKFPGIVPRLLVLNGHFDFPLYREYLMAAGVCGVTKDSVRHLLTKEGTGNGVCILIGGALEALESRPGEHSVLLSTRKGFIKLAMENGASLVPIYSFGETELFKQAKNPEGSFLKRMQLFLTRYLGISPPVFIGRGIFNYTFGLLPRRRPVHTVVGAPLKLPHLAKPTSEDVNKYHAIYQQHLVDLFEAHKQTYGLKDDCHLKIL